ncbi:MAG: ImmA/IrrE family metallo-endopeptidase [Spirochaetaceae bacterium]|jgi:Zn-dependent peptidase ImmA (M78 family)|nr:ImmA/IrrE family metallo-endopeptidase [Spirochaetaceae bacterium]
MEVKKNISNFRSRYGLSDREPIDLPALLIKLNILTLFKPLDDSISGIVGELNEDTRFMLINSNHTLGRQNFTIAHELYHLFYDSSFKTILCDRALEGTEEKKADLFAGILLLPENGLLELIPPYELKKNKIKTATLLKIESSYKSSRAALLHRLRDLELVDKEYSEVKKEHILSAALAHGFDIDIYEPGNEGKIIGDYISLSKSLFDNEIISESSFKHFLNDIGKGELFIE